MPKAPQMHPWQKYSTQKILRSQIILAVYNPRFLDVSARKRLRDGLEDVGLLETLVWNERTGVLVSGHQRLSLMDERAKYNADTHANDYLLEVARIDVDEDTERKANILLNNQSIQGQFDLSLLGEMFEHGTNPFEAGFDELETELLFGEDAAADWLKRYKPDETLDAGESAALEDATKTDEDVQRREEEKIALIKQRKGEWQEKARDNNSSDHTLILVFPDTLSREEYLQSIDFDTNKRFLPSDIYLKHLDAATPRMALDLVMSEKGYDLNEVLAAHEANGEPEDLLIDAMLHQACEELLLKLTDDQRASAKLPEEAEDDPDELDAQTQP